MKKYSDFILGIKKDILDIEDACPCFDEFMDWMHDIVDTADDPEARAGGMFYRADDVLYFQDVRVSCWRFCEDMARLFGYIEGLQKQRKKWHYVRK